MRKQLLLMSLLSAWTVAHAQSYVTYNHDDAKMNQITVMETGAGSLTPEFYYWALHNNYKKSAQEKNKLGFRTLAGIGAYQQVPYAEEIDSALTKRAKIEALNMADRQVDLAWQTEGTKINDKLATFSNNINRIVPAGGSPMDYQRWREYYNVYQTAIKVTRDAYMPNAQRKREYLAIYADICKQNETLVKQMVQWNNKLKTAQLLASHNNYRHANKANAASNAFGAWREAGWAARGSSSNSGGGNDADGDETVNK